MRGVVVSDRDFLTCCPHRYLLYHALESCTTALLGGYNPIAIKSKVQLEQMQLYPLYSSIWSSGDLDKAITCLAAVDGYIGTNNSIASTEFAALATIMWMRTGSPAGLVTRAAMCKGETDFIAKFSYMRDDQQMTFMKSLPRSLFPRWKDGDWMPTLRLSVEWSYTGPHSNNFYGCRENVKSLPEICRADTVAQFPIRIEPVDTEPYDA